MTPRRSNDTSSDPITQREFSAGGVVVRGDDVVVIVPVKRDTAGNRVLGLPKGHPDGSETAEAAALREVREETGVQGEVITFFLVEYRSGDLSDHDHEVEEARWIPLTQAARSLTYAGEREMVVRALSQTASDR
jgi:ADP-ribose pyrophosphatase YjhB (NUDIX family)